MLSMAVFGSADGAPLSSSIQPVTECHQSLLALKCSTPLFPGSPAAAWRCCLLDPQSWLSAVAHPQQHCVKGPFLSDHPGAALAVTLPPPELWETQN